MKKVWVVKIGEPIPYVFNERNDRSLRAINMADYLSKKGYQITFWTSRFSHQHKKHRDVVSNSFLKTASKNIEVIYLDSPGYLKNISIKRFIDHFLIGLKFKKLSQVAEKPDLIICSFPIPELSYWCVKYGKKNNIPVVIYLRDMWPDVLIERLKTRLVIPLKSLAYLFSFPYILIVRWSLHHADSLIGITPGFLEWGQTIGSRPNSKQLKDTVVYQSKKMPKASSKSKMDYDVDSFISAMRRSKKVLLVWSGSLISDTDGRTLLKAIKSLPKRVSKDLYFVFCGIGDLVPEIKEIEQNVDNVKYFSWLDANNMNSILKISDYGLLCYLDREDFRRSIPNKILDYLMANLRIVSSVKGEIDILITDKQCRIKNYQAGCENSLQTVFEEIQKNLVNEKRKLPVNVSALKKLDYNLNMEGLVEHLDVIISENENGH